MPPTAPGEPPSRLGLWRDRLTAGLRKIQWPGGLSSRLLLLVAAFTLIAEIMILLPSLAAFQERWLLERERAAEVATLAVEGAPDSLVRDSDKFARRLVAGATIAGTEIGHGGPDQGADDRRAVAHRADLNVGHKHAGYLAGR